MGLEEKMEKGVEIGSNSGACEKRGMEEFSKMSINHIRC